MQNSRPSDGTIGQAPACIMTSGNIPQGLHLDDAAIFNPVKFVETHMREMACRGNIEKSGRESADEVASAADPLRTMLILSGNDDPVTPLKIGPGSLQFGQCLVVECSGAMHITERKCKPKHRVCCSALFKRGKQRGLVPVILGGPKAVEAVAVVGGSCHHSAASP